MPLVSIYASIQVFNSSIGIAEMTLNAFIRNTILAVFATSDKRPLKC